VIEAIFEDMKAKHDLFKDLDSICHEGTIFASNTSSLSIAEMATVTNRPERVVGLHYFFPSVINQLLEIIATEETAPEVIETLRVYSRVTGKVPVVVKDAPGFAVNRYFVPWLNEAVRILDDNVANIPTIDAAAREAFHIGMGPFALMNATGVPIAYHSTVALADKLGDFYAPADGLTKQFEAEQPWDLEGDEDEKAKASIGERLLGVVFGVAAQLVDEGVATVEDTDRGALVGLRWARGPFAMMNELGLARSFELVEQIAEQQPSFTVPKNLSKQAKADIPWTLRDVKLELDNQIAVITMNRPQAMNALNEKVLSELQEIVAEIQSNPDVRAVIITGEGSAFVAGADIRTMLSASKKEVEKFTQFGQSVLTEVEKLEKPVIAAINGFALGGGLELALACDIRLASTDARLGFPEVGLGIFPGFGGTQRASRLVGKGAASELIFSGIQIGADEAVRIGLVNRAVPPQELMMEARRLALRIARQGPLAVRGAKLAVNEAFQSDLESGLEFELREVLKTFESKDQKEGMEAFLERRRPEFKGQ
jgi:enoyl-CoA hydratase/3-hydroxyacyl-CoA dehydrogenase